MSISCRNQINVKAGANRQRGALGTGLSPKSSPVLVLVLHQFKDTTRLHARPQTTQLQLIDRNNSIIVLYR